MSSEDPSIVIMAWFSKGNVALASSKGVLLQHCFSTVHAVPTHIPPRGMLLHETLRKVVVEDHKLFFAGEFRILFLVVAIRIDNNYFYFIFLLLVAFPQTF